MKKQVDWSQILIQCKHNVQKRIKPLLKTLDRPQPNLGIGAGGDQIKEIDIAAENAIVNTLRKRHVSFTLISEESGIREYGATPHENYVTTDPIDGTTNLMRKVPFYATSIAVSTKPMLNSIHAALVVDLFHDVAYMAQRKKGAYRNGQRIAPSENTSLENAVIGVDLNSYKVQEIASQLTALIQRTKHLRHFGANALELCYVADGTTDAFIDIRGKLRTTDMAAAWLILMEAGAIMTTQDGGKLNAKLDPKKKVKFIAAANQTIHRLIVDLMTSKKERKC